MPRPEPTPRRFGQKADKDVLESLVSAFGKSIADKVETRAGEPEDRLRAPFEQLLEGYGRAIGLRVVASGEVHLPDLGIRPDYAIEVAGARMGYVELKAPGKRVPASKAPVGKAKVQWEGLKNLPNVIYTDGQEWALYRTGKLVGNTAKLTPSVETAGPKLRPYDGGFERILQSFLKWKPESPRTLRELVESVSALCRLLRDEVAWIMKEESLRRTGSAHFTRLASEWRGLLFPNLTDAQFANDYAQTVTFALLLARVEGINFEDRSVGEIALLLGKKHSLMGRALTVLVNDTVERDSIVIDTMLRIIGVVNWERYDRHLYTSLFEQFLKAYDPEQRKLSGSYYTPDTVVTFMVDFVNGLLIERLDRDRGFASDGVIVVDPAMGTGSFLARIIDCAARTVRDTEGPGQVPPRLRSLASRVIGFEKQVAPYAIAQMRLHSLLKNGYGAEPPREEFRFLTDTLDNPDHQELQFGSIYEELQQSRRGANRVKRDVPVMVVISNPPYLRQVGRTAPWIEDAGDDRVSRPNLDAFRLPGNGKFEHVLLSSSTFFWRWGTWKVFDAHRDAPSGVVAFVSPSSFLTTAGFAGMRKYLRETADEGWIVDLSPEPFRPPTGLRVFPENRNGVCVAVFIRYGACKPRERARVWYTAVEGTRAQKLAALGGLGIRSTAWTSCESDWTASLTPPQTSDWPNQPTPADVFRVWLPGVKPNRTWLYAPVRDVLQSRWDRLIAAPYDEKKLLFKETDAIELRSAEKVLPGFSPRGCSIGDESGECPEPVRVAFRPFDRQWTIPDGRLHHRPSPDLWRVLGKKQIYMTEQNAHVFTEGPGALFSAYPPDMDHFLGYGGGRVIPLYRDSEGRRDNLAPGLTEYLADVYGTEVDALDVLSYVAGIVAHREYTVQLRSDFSSPGLRIPFTRNAELWHEVGEVGRCILYLHTYGDRCKNYKRKVLDQVAASGIRPTKSLTVIPDSKDDMPVDYSYDPATETLRVGAGSVGPVSPSVWQYRVGRKQVIKKWLDYRMASPAYRWSTPLNDMNMDSWTSGLTGELLALANTLASCIAFETTQGRLLRRVLSCPLIELSDLENVGIYPMPASARSIPGATRRGKGSIGQMSLIDDI
jgi:hypothetical protein